MPSKQEIYTCNDQDRCYYRSSAHGEQADNKRSRTQVYGNAVDGSGIAPDAISRRLTLQFLPSFEKGFECSQRAFSREPVLASVFAKLARIGQSLAYYGTE